MSKYSLQKRVRYARYENGKNIMHLICHETSIQIFPIECKLHQHLVRDGNPLPHYMATPEQNPGVDPTRTATMDAGKIIELLGRPENYPAWLWHSHFATWPSHGPVESSWIFPIDSMAHLSSSLHSYVNLYQRLLRCSYGFPMVFPWFSHWKLHFPEATTACCSSKPCRQDSPSRSTKPWRPKRRGCPPWPDVPPESDHRGEVTQCEAPQWC